MNKDIKNYAWLVTAYDKRVYESVRKCIDENEERFLNKQIIIFGAGARGSEISVILEELNPCPLIFADNNSQKWGGMIDKYPIISPNDAFDMKDKAIFLISTEESAEIEEQFADNGLVENHDFFVIRTSAYKEFVQEFDRVVKEEVLFFADCMFAVISFRDKIKLSLTEMIEKDLGKNQVKLLTMHGMNIRSYYHILKAQVRKAMKPKTVLLMVNFETLTGKQHLLPRSQHTELIEKIAQRVPDDHEMQEYLSIVKDRFQNVQAEFFVGEETNKAGVIGNSAARIFFKLHYLYKLDKNIEPIQYLIKAIRYCKNNEIEIIPFVPPVNYEYGIELFGEEFENLYQRNLLIIKQICEEESCLFLDLSHCCCKEQFADVTTPDETTNYYGRKIVVNKIRDILEERKKYYEH